MIEWDPPTAAGMLRARVDAVVSSWELAIRADVPELSSLQAPELQTHVGQLIAGLAESLEDPSSTAAAVWTVVDAHALQRLRRGIAIAAVVREYAQLRLCLHAALAGVA